MRRFSEHEFCDLGTAFDKSRRRPPRDPVVTVKWQPEKFEKEREMRKAADHIEHIQHLTSMVERGEIGKNVAHLRAKAAHDASGFDIDRKDARGKVMSDAQQFEHFCDHHPVGKAFRQACAHGLEDTQSELEKEYAAKNDLDEAHERQRELASGHHGRNPRGQVQKQTETVSSVCNAALDKAATELLAKARQARVPGATYARIYSHLITKTQWGRSIASLEQFSRIQV
jgi:hypothetical protein